MSTITALREHARFLAVLSRVKFIQKKRRLMKLIEAAKLKTKGRLDAKN